MYAQQRQVYRSNVINLRTSKTFDLYQASSIKSKIKHLQNT